MRCLTKPEIKARQAFDLCIASIRDNDLASRMKLVVNAIELAETEYVSHGERATLYQIAAATDIAGGISVGEMERVYKGTFVRSVGTRYIYDMLRKQPENDICPLCGQRTVSTLDHYLPQSSHPALIITPVNLVPACSECNKSKLARQASVAIDQTLHPYFDDLGDGRWLYAEVKVASPTALIFSVTPPDEWADTLRQRVVVHFRTFGLGALYASHAAVELSNIRYALRAMAAENPASVISDHLRGRAKSCASASANSWQRATYEALADSDWFCEGGFG